MAFSGPAGDRNAIRDRYGAYSDSAFRMDVDDWLANWTGDGAWHVMGKAIEGKEALRHFHGRLKATIKQMCFFTEIGAIEVSGDTASARCYTHEIFLTDEHVVEKVVGIYNDYLVRRHGEWLFRRREHKVLLTEPAVSRSGSA